MLIKGTLPHLLWMERNTEGIRKNVVVASVSFFFVRAATHVNTLTGIYPGNPGIAYLVSGSSKTECGPCDVPLFSHTGSSQKQGRPWPAHSLIRIAIVIC